MNDLDKSEKLSAVFSNAGHFIMHYFGAMFFTVVIAIDREWESSYESLFELWLPASLLIGLVALPAGRLADKWSSPGMLVIMFIGMGLASIVCSFVNTEKSLMIFLGSLGIFAGIYHPVGIPWTIKTGRKKIGMRLAINGLSGGLGVASSSMLSGWFILHFGWRSSFLIPGLGCFFLGLIMLWTLNSKKLLKVKN